MKKLVLLIALGCFFCVSITTQCQKPYIMGEAVGCDTVGLHWHVLICFQQPTSYPMTVHSRLMTFPDTTISVQDTTYQFDSVSPCTNVYFPRLQYNTSYYYFIVFTNDSGSCRTYATFQTTGPLTVPVIQQEEPSIAYHNDLIQVQGWEHRGNLVVYDMVGRILFLEIVTEGNTSYRMPQLAAGGYIAALLDEKGQRIAVCKLVK